MSCKMIDALTDASADTWTWHYIVSAHGTQPGPNICPFTSDEPVAQIAREYRLKEVPEGHRTPKDREGLLALIELIRRRCAALAAERARKKFRREGTS